MSNKLCPNGHIMDPSWDVCPYCPKSAPVPRPTGGGFGTEGPGAIYQNPQQPRMTSHIQQPSAGRKTVLFKEKKAPLIGWLVAMNGRQEGQNFRLSDGKNVIGSDPACEVVISEEFISGRHASLSKKDNKFFITDLDSANGTFLRGEEVSKEELRDLDEIKIGETVLKFKIF